MVVVESGSVVVAVQEMRGGIRTVVLVDFGDKVQPEGQFLGSVMMADCRSSA